MNIAWREVKEKFQQIWGYEDFRPPQGEIVQALLTGQDALIILPTGGGKSICFQLPALLQTGLTIVVSPLVALMENQVNQLKHLRLSGALLHSELPRSERKKTLDAIALGQLSLLYLSPETLLSLPVWKLIAQPEVKITGTKIAIAAFTATADPQAQREISLVLELKQPKTWLISPYRDNLSLNIRTVWTPRGRKQQMLRFIQTKANQSGLIYVRSRKDSQTLAAWLKSEGYAAAAYHAGLITSERRKIEQGWISSKIQFVICTSAFGMGIDKPDVRWIVHYHSPELLAEYIQEVGRGGRDGKPAEALTLISEPTGWLDPEDRQRNQFFHHKLEQQYRQAQKIVGQLPQQSAIATIKEQFPHGEISLGILHSLGLVSWSDPFHYYKRSAQVSLNRLALSQKHHQKQMQQYLRTKQCRWQYLLQAFDFRQEAQEFKCGTCDNCRNAKSS